MFVYERIVKACPVCFLPFVTRKNHKREKTTCSHSCSNTFFALLRNKPEKYKNYRTICFKYWPKECLICGWNRIVEVHHFDNNHKNNDKNNLVPLCPNHHAELISKRFKDETYNLLCQKIILRNVA